LKESPGHDPKKIKSKYVSFSISTKQSALHKRPIRPWKLQNRACVDDDDKSHIKGSLLRDEGANTNITTMGSDGEKSEEVRRGVDDKNADVGEVAKGDDSHE